MGFRMNRGFTLIEMIITIVVLGILGVFTFTFFGDYMNTYTQMRNRRSDHQEALYIIERITREFRNANNATVTCATPFVFTLPTGGTPADSSTTITYTRSGTELYRNGNSSGNILIGDHINNFVVSPVGTNCCSFSVTKGDVQYQTTVCPKNVPSSSLGFGGNYADNL